MARSAVQERARNAAGRPRATPTTKQRRATPRMLRSVAVAHREAAACSRPAQVRAYAAAPRAPGLLAGAAVLRKAGSTGPAGGGHSNVRLGINDMRGGPRPALGRLVSGPCRRRQDGSVCQHMMKAAGSLPHSSGGGWVTSRLHNGAAALVDRTVHGALDAASRVVADVVADGLPGVRHHVHAVLHLAHHWRAGVLGCGRC